MTSITIRRFSSGSPVQPAPYVPGVSTDTLAVQDASGNWWALAHTGEAYPEWFGAVRDGVTDDASPIRSAISYLHGLGVKSTLRLAIGTYLMSSYATGGAFGSGLYILPLWANVSIVGQGDGSVLKVGNSISVGTDITVLAATSISNDVAGNINNVLYRDFLVDNNGANNGGAYGSGRSSFVIYYGDDITLDSVTIINNPGSQPVICGFGGGPSQPTTPTVGKVRFLNCKVFDFGHVVNVNIGDSSGLYIIARDFIVENCIFANSSQDTFGTGCELHGSGVAVGNVVDKIKKGFNVGAYPDSKCVVTGNYITNAFVAVTFWNTIGGGWPVWTTDAVFSNNVVDIIDVSGASVVQATAGSILSTGEVKIKIAHNVFNSREAAGTTSVNWLIAVGQLTQCDIIGNTAKNFSGGFLFTSDDNADNANLTIDGNTIIDCCRSSNSAQPEYKAAISISGSYSGNQFGSLNIRNNTIRNSGTVYMTRGIYGGAGRSIKSTGKGIVSGNNISNVTTPIDFADFVGNVEGIWRTFTPTLTATTGTFATTGTLTGSYKVENNLMVISWDLGLTSATGGTNGFTFGLPSGFIAAATTVAHGKELNLTGKTLNGYINIGSAVFAQGRYFDNSDPNASGARFIMHAAVTIAP